MDNDNLNEKGVLDDAGMVQTPGEGQEPTPPIEAPDTSNETKDEIGSLEEAMRAFNAAKSKATESDVSTGKATEKPGDAPAEGSGSAEPSDKGAVLPDTSGATVAQVSEIDPSQGEGITGGAGELTGNDEVYDPAVGIAQVRQQLASITQDAVNKEFAKQGKKKISVNDLMKTDEKNGTKEFINPDTGRPFSSSNPRSEAQAFVKDFNDGLNAEFYQACQQLYPNVEQSYRPMIEFHNFLPTWQKMDEFRQNMFEELVAGYELTDKNGEIVAYNLDLNATYNQMEKQIQWILSQQQALSGTQTGAEGQVAVDTNPIAQPATAAPTSTKNAVNDKDTKQYDMSNISDAVEYYNKQKKKNK